MIEAPRRFDEEFNIVIQTYNPSFSDVYQLVHMFIGRGQATHGRKPAQPQLPEKDLNKRSPNLWQMVEH